MAYKELRARFGLTAQAAVRTISKVADAFKVSRDAAPVFRADAAQPYDDRILRFVQDGNAVSLWTLEGRMVVPLVMGEYQRALMTFRKGEVDLCRVRGKWILVATCDIPETETFKATDWIGVDLGIVNIAADSDGRAHTGAEIERKRRRHQQRRNGLQQCGSKAAAAWMEAGILEEGLPSPAQVLLLAATVAQRRGRLRAIPLLVWAISGGSRPAVLPLQDPAGWTGAFLGQVAAAAQRGLGDLARLREAEAAAARLAQTGRRACCRRRLRRRCGRRR